VVDVLITDKTDPNHSIAQASDRYESALYKADARASTATIKIVLRNRFVDIKCDNEVAKFSCTQAGLYRFDEG